ncbi:MAG: hypothetical protein HC888_18665 [Candidatus Competibacteraceae bacterium]|nr:hypothetical protein [Candidatus Competibacteraceae bacterium]
MGGIATGKTSLGHAILEEARAGGRTATYLWDPGVECHGTELEQWGAPFTDGLSTAPRLREDIVDCDLLVIDEASSWFRQHPARITAVIALRTQLRRSTVLIMTSYYVKAMAEQELQASFAQVLRLDATQLAPVFRTDLRRLQYPGRKLSEVMEMLGIWHHLGSRQQAWFDVASIPEDRSSLALLDNLQVLPLAWCHHWARAKRRLHLRCRSHLACALHGRGERAQ